MIEAERYYRILDLEPGASPEEVHQGYLDLTWVWHPDRFTGHPRLQQKAVYKLQELNEAHERLRSCRKTPKTKNSGAKSPSQASEPVPNQSAGESLYKPQVNRTWGGSDQRTVKDYRQSVNSRVRDVGEWLD